MIFNLRKKQIFRKGVSALIINKRDEFLLVNLVSFKKHFFAVPGGGVEQGETLQEAAYREIEEELGITKSSLQFLGSSEEPTQFEFKTKKLNRDGIEYDGSERYFFGFRFTGENSQIKPDVNEVRSYKWVSYADLKAYLLFDNQWVETLEKISEAFPFMEEESI